MTEIIFLVEEDIDGGYIARSLSESIFTQAENLIELRAMVKDAVHYHYPDEQNHPKARLHTLLKGKLNNSPSSKRSWIQHPQHHQDNIFSFTRNIACKK
jgi:hypothetical protein